MEDCTRLAFHKWWSNDQFHHNFDSDAVTRFVRSGW